MKLEFHNPEYQNEKNPWELSQRDMEWYIQKNHNLRNLFVNYFGDNGYTKTDLREFLFNWMAGDYDGE